MAQRQTFKSIMVSAETYYYLEEERNKLEHALREDGDLTRVSIHDVVKNMILLQEDVRLGKQG